MRLGLSLFTKSAMGQGQIVGAVTRSSSSMPAARQWFCRAGNMKANGLFQTKGSGSRLTQPAMDDVYRHRGYRRNSAPANSA